MKRNRLERGPAIWLTVLLATGALGLTSCGDGRVPAYPVRGKVLYEGRPAEYATVVFYPQGGSESLQEIKPHGRVGADGYYSVKTYIVNDGAPAGDYKVAIEWPGEDPAEPGDPDDPEYVPFGPDRLQGRYADPETSGFRVTIVKGDNQLEPFELR